MARAKSSCGSRAARWSSQAISITRGDLQVQRAATGRSVWFSPVYFDGPDPFMSIAMPHSGRDAGSTVAEINLKFLSSFINPEQIGTDNEGFYRTARPAAARALCHRPRLGTNLADLPQVAAAIRSDAEPVIFWAGPDGSSVLTASATVPRMQWYVFFEQPLSKALQPVYNLLFRTAWLLRAGRAPGRAGRHAPGAKNGHSDSRLAGRCPAVGGEAISAIASKCRRKDEIADLADHFNRIRQTSCRVLRTVGAESRRTHARSCTVGQRAKALEEIGRAVASSLDDKAVLRHDRDARAVNSRRPTPAPSTATMHREAPSISRKRTHSTSLTRTRFAPAGSEWTKAYWGWRAKKQEAMWISDLSSARAIRSRSSPLRPGFNSVLVVPLIGPDEILGALVLLRRASGTFRQHDRPDADPGPSVGPRDEQCETVSRSRRQGTRACRSPTNTRLSSLPT